MKNTLKLLLIFMCTLTALNAYAYSSEDFSEIPMRDLDGFYTRITDTDGELHTYDGIIDNSNLENYENIEKISSYEICFDEKTLMNVKLNDIVYCNPFELFSQPGIPLTNGYYSVKFTLSEADNTEVFLTGLSVSNIEMVQDKILSSQITKSQLSMESLDFIDTEKTSLKDNDDLLCWAAQASNMLHYTGWAKKADSMFSNPDSLFDLFTNHFSNDGGNSAYGIEWFFNGVYSPQNASGWSQVNDYSQSGMYLPQYDIYQNTGTVSIYDNYKQFNTMNDCLEMGYGVGLSVNFYNSSLALMGSHAITEWGYICDKDYGRDNKNYYKAVIVSDSDSDELPDSNRRLAPNKLRVLSMVPAYYSWKLDGYGGYLCMMSGGSILKSYSDALPYETDASATLNRFTAADIIPNGIEFIPTNSSNVSMPDGFMTNQSIYMLPYLYNNSHIASTDAVPYNITIKNASDNTEILNKDYIYNEVIPSYSESDLYITEPTIIENLDAGQYTLTVSINCDHSLPEAYFYNNNHTYNFKVYDREYDLSDAKLNATVGELTANGVYGNFTCSGLDNITSSPESDIIYTLVASYYENGEWTDWEYVSDINGDIISDTAMPEEGYVRPVGSKVKFRLDVDSKSGSFTSINLYSDEIPQRYSIIKPIVTDTKYTPLEAGAKKLSDGEKFNVKVSNKSSYDSGTISGNLVILAYDGYNTPILYRKDNINLSYGESIDISVDSWDADLSGSYIIYAIVENGDYEDAVKLGSLKVSESPSFVVTTANDTVDQYDNLTSLREASANIESFGTDDDKITFSDTIEKINLTSSITIASHVTLSGTISDNVCKPLITFTSSESEMFKVTENGFLEADNLCFSNGNALDSGGVVNNNGGKVSMSKCIFKSNSSGTSGGAIYTNGGKVKLNGCTMYENASGYGGAIAVDGGAILDMLNCNLYNNTSNGGAIYNNNGTANIMYTIFDNNTAKYSGGGAVTSFGKTNMAGCIAIGNGITDIFGKANIYGSYIGTADSKAIVDLLTVNGTYDEMYKCVNGKSVWSAVTNTPSLSKKIYDGISLKNENGYVIYSNDGESQITSDILSSFTDEEYSIDINGNSHDNLFGSCAQAAESEIISYDGETVNMFVPNSTKAVLISKTESNIKLYEHEFNAGTNAISIETDGENPMLMLWNGAYDMKPLCKALDIR